ncbi:MAG: MMPL family transporter [Rikenellaceae bacterium]
MGNIFIHIYDYFLAHKVTRWIILLLSVVVMAVLSLQVAYVEDITSFFPNQSSSKRAFEALKAKDKVAMLLWVENGEEQSQYALMDCVDSLALEFARDETFTQNAEFNVGVSDAQIDGVSSFVYNNLPLFLDDEDYDRLERIITPDSVAQKMEQNYNQVISPIGGFVSEYIYQDPLGIGSHLLGELQNLGGNFSYKMIDGYLFSKDGTTIISYIEPIRDADTKALIRSIERIVQQFSNENKDVKLGYYGAPFVAEYNARQIKSDSIITLNIALLLVVVLLSVAFRNKYSALLVLSPVVYGALFALSIIAIIKGSISLIAVGAGSIIFGIALSYSIHLLSHTLYSSNVREVIRDLAFPLTVGSFTTIGAFAGLMFTSSSILQDLGLFASLTLIGTTLFALIFLPHFMSSGVGHNVASSKLLRIANSWSDIIGRYSRPIIIVIVVTTLVSAYFAEKVGFDSNMMNLNYNAPELAEAESRLTMFSAASGDESNVFFIASSDVAENSEEGYNAMCGVLDSLKESSQIASYSAISKFVIPKPLSEQRLDRWNMFWSEHSPKDVISSINSAAQKTGFESGAFDMFTSLLAKDYKLSTYQEELAFTFPDWISGGQDGVSYLAQVRLAESKKAEVYSVISQDSRWIAADRAFFANQMVADVNHNFSLVLYISGLLVFIAMMICYGRIEITLMAFAPMAISWIIILGIMAICGIEFNIVTIILSTFIFGIGDDFSIFMMDGLLGEYRDKKELLAQHKTAIFFSAFTVIVGMGALVFAKHPAMNSLGAVSLIGILIVVLVSYTLQPAMFKFFISKPTSKSGFPFTLLSLLNTIYAFGLFVFGCLVVQVLMLTVLPLPIGRKRRVSFVRWSAHKFCKYFLRVMITTRLVVINEHKERFDKPAVIIANHQSFIDILMLLSLDSRFVMVTNSWVWNSPFFGRIVQYLGFFNTSNGYEAIVESLREATQQGCSVIVFPEGTRSEDCQIKRFHKGAFYLAEELNLDIIPILIYGNGLVSSKRQGLYIKHGLLVSKILDRISPANTDFGVGYKERSKQIARYFRSEYHRLYEELNRTSNPYFRDAIIKNYIYKGPVLEWYMKVKLRLEGWYDKYDRLLPRKGVIVDLGCGYGAMSYMLSMLSSQRQILGVDYDEDKIAVANNAFLQNDRISFRSGDIRTIELPEADAFIISDVLHYIDLESQQKVIKNCLSKLREGGVLVIKDGDSTLDKRHSNTVESERWSTQIVKFNKTDGELCFLSREFVDQVAADCGWSVRCIDDNSRLSNIIFVITK